MKGFFLSFSSCEGEGKSPCTKYLGTSSNEVESKCMCGQQLLELELLHTVSKVQINNSIYLRSSPKVGNPLGSWIHWYRYHDTTCPQKSNTTTHTTHTSHGRPNMYRVAISTPHLYKNNRIVGGTLRWAHDDSMRPKTVGRTRKNRPIFNVGGGWPRPPVFHSIFLLSR